MVSCFFSTLRRRWATFVVLLIAGSSGVAGWVILQTHGHPEAAPVAPKVESKQEAPSAPKGDSRLVELRTRLEGLEFQAHAEEEQVRDRERRLSALNGSSLALERQIEELRSRQDKAAARVRALEADEHRFREALPAGNEADSLASPVVDRLRGEMNRIRGEIALGGFERDPGSPEYKTRSARLAELGESLRSELYKVRAETIVTLRNSIKDLDDDLRSLDERKMRKGLEARALSEEIRELGSRREEIAAVRREIADVVAKGSTSAPAPILPPVDPHKGSGEEDHGSTRRMIGWGTLGVVVLALLGVFWRDATDPRVRTDRDVKQRLNLPAIALVEDAGHDPLVFRRHPQDPLSETMSTAATVLRSYLAEREFRTVAVTSARAGEGKTTTAMNLACALARKGLNVLLVDADLRRPRLHEIYALDNSKGLSTLLLGPEPAEAEPDPDQIIMQTEIPTLRVLPAGPTNEVGADLHDSPRMIDLLRTQRERFDAVILDAPPLTGVGDAVALARVVDTCLWVVRSGQADRSSLGWAKHLLKTVHADVAGVVLNCAPSSRGERFYSYPVTARA